MTSVTIITDIDPHTPMVGGIFTYVKQFSSFAQKKNITCTLISRKRSPRMVKLFQFNKAVRIAAKSNYTYFLKLLRYFFVPLQSDVYFAQRADFLVPFLLKKGRKVIIYHGNPQRELTHKKGWMTSKFFGFLESLAVAKSDAVIVVNKETKIMLTRKYGKLRNVFTIPVGVDIQQFKPLDRAKVRKSFGFRPNEKIALFIGRFSVEKQVTFIGEELKKMKSLTTVFVGEGPVKPPKARNIRVMNPVPHDQLPQLINCADCVVLFSTYEGMPNVVLEALACGKPVVSSDVGDIGDVVINGQTGFLVSKENFSKTVKHLIKNPRKYQKKCRATAEQYSWDNIGKKIERILLP